MSIILPKGVENPNKKVSENSVIPFSGKVGLVSNLIFKHCLFVTPFQTDDIEFSEFHYCSFTEVKIEGEIKNCVFRGCNIMFFILEKNIDLSPLKGSNIGCFVLRGLTIPDAKLESMFPNSKIERGVI